MVEVFDSTTRSSDAMQDPEIVDRWREVLVNNDTKKIDGINTVLRDEFGTDVEIVDIQPGSIRCYLLSRTLNV